MKEFNFARRDGKFYFMIRHQSFFLLSLGFWSGVAICQIISVYLEKSLLLILEPLV